MAVRKKRSNPHSVPQSSLDALTEANRLRKKEVQGNMMTESDLHELRMELRLSAYDSLEVPKNQPVPLGVKVAWLKRFKVNHGNASRTSQDIGVSIKTMRQYKEKDKQFGQAWDEIVADLAENAEAELYKRAVVGFEEELTYQGMATGDTVTKKSDTCLIFYLKGNKEKYRRTDGHQTQVNITNNVDVLGDAKLNEIASAALDDEAMEGEFEEVHG